MTLASPIVLPWAPGYTSTSNPVPTDAVLPWLGPVVPLPPPAPVPVPIPEPIPVPVPHAPASPSVLDNTFENAIKAAGHDVQKMVERFVVNELGKVLPSSPPPPPVLDSDVLTKAAARDRAIRTLLYGMGISAVWGMASALASAGGVDWFTKNGLLSAASMVAVTAGHSVLSYIGRIKWAPPTPVGMLRPLD
jgi:hypothetical protein